MSNCFVQPVITIFPLLNCFSRISYDAATTLNFNPTISELEEINFSVNMIADTRCGRNRRVSLAVFESNNAVHMTLIWYADNTEALVIFCPQQNLRL